MICVNCGTADNVAPRSYDMDLPVFVLCGVCAYLLAADYGTFREVGARYRGKTD